MGLRKGVVGGYAKGPSGRARQARDNKLAKEGKVAGAFQGERSCRGLCL
jgi:hypothetical protein